MLDPSFWTSYHTFGLVRGRAWGSSACDLPACRHTPLLAAWLGALILPPATTPQDWSPGEYVRWYIDGHFLYEVNKEALRAQTNSTGACVCMAKVCHTYVQM